LRVVEQLIDHLRGTGHLTDEQLEQLRRMGLFRDKPLNYDDFDTGFDSGPIAIGPVDIEADRADDLDEYGDRLLDDSKPRTRRRGGRRPAGGNSRMFGALADALAEAQDFAGLVREVAQRLNPDSDVDDAPRLVRSAEHEALNSALTRGGLWADLWPHIEIEPLVSDLADGQRRRLGNLLAAKDPTVTSQPRGFDPVVRRAIDLIEAQRTLSDAFNRITFRLEHWRTFSELRLFENPLAYEVLVIQFNARAEARSIGDLPHLQPDVGLPTPAWLPNVRFVDGWRIAARLDPVGVLPFMQKCQQPWSMLEAHSRGLNCRRLVLPGRRAEFGNWIPPSSAEWFSIDIVDRRWVRRRHRPTGFTQLDTFRPWESGGQRAEYGALWAAGLFDMPLLTCPNEWELT
jgi:hypothetical protein